MPSFLTHYILGNQAVNKLDNNLRKIIKDNYYAFSVGTNGPDVFFYNNCLPWHDSNQSKVVANYGSINHRYNINKFFKEFIENANDSISKSFVSGYLCHWAMDKVCHPFVYYNTEGSDLSLPYHKEFESTIDHFILNDIMGISIRDIKPYSLLKYDNESLKSIYKVLYKPFKEVYNIDLKENDVYDSCIHIYKAQKLLYDPYGIKKKVIRLLENNILNKPFEYSCMIIPHKFNNSLDITNEKHNTWHHPYTNKPSNESFMDLYNTSLNTALSILNLYDSYLNGESTINDILNYINNENFDNGLSEYYENNLYYDCIYEKKNT